MILCRDSTKLCQNIHDNNTRAVWTTIVTEFSHNYLSYFVILHPNSNFFADVTSGGSKH